MHMYAVTAVNLTVHVYLPLITYNIASNDSMLNCQLRMYLITGWILACDVIFLKLNNAFADIIKITYKQH